MFHVYSRVETFQKHPNCYLIVPSQQWKHDSNVWNLFEFSNIDTRATSLISFGGVFVVIFEQMLCIDLAFPLLSLNKQMLTGFVLTSIECVTYARAIIWPKVFLKRTIRLNKIAPEHSFRIVKMDMPLIQSNELRSLMVVIAHCFISAILIEVA